MAVLTQADQDAVWADVMAYLSGITEPIPVTKDQISAFVGIVDAALDTAEVDIVAGLPAGDSKTWLLANAWIGREIMARVEQKRRDVL